MATDTLQISLDVPIRSVGMVAGEAGEAQAALKKQEAELKRQREQVSRLRAVLETAGRRLESFYRDTVCSQAECVARLSVRIAERILQREITAGNYDIAAVVAEVLKAAPTQKDVLVRLNPQDMELYTQITEQHKIKPPTGVQFTADPTIGRAECVVETGQGTVEYLIDEHLRQIGEALEAVR